MDSVFSALCGLFFLLTPAVFAQPEFDFSAVNTDLSVGDEATMTCVATNPIAGQVITLERYYPEEDGVPEYIVELAVNGQMNEPLQEPLSRYSTSIVPTQDVDYIQFTLTLTISGVQPEDTGNYRCGSRTAGLYGTVTLTVRTPPESVELYYINGGEELLMGEGDNAEITIDGDSGNIQVRCVVTGGYPEAEVAIMIGEEDITDRFTSIPEHSYDPVPVGNKELRVYSYTSTYDASSLSVNFGRHGDRQLSCKARQRGQQEFTLSKEFYLRFTIEGMAPIVDCPSIVVSYNMATNANITCTVQALPNVGESFITWRHMEGSDSSTTLQDGEQQQYYTARLSETEVTGQYTLSLHFSRVHLQAFREYRFVAINALGRGEDVVTLQRDENLETWSSAPSTAAPVVFILVTAMISALLQHL